MTLEAMRARLLKTELKVVFFGRELHGFVEPRLAQLFQTFVRIIIADLIGAPDILEGLTVLLDVVLPDGLILDVRKLRLFILEALLFRK